MIKGLEHLSYEEKLRKLGLKKAQGDLINVCQYIKGRCKEGRARLFAAVLSDRTRGTNWNAEVLLEHHKTQTHILLWGCLITGIGCLERMWLPSLVIFRTHLNMGNWLWVALLEQGVGQDDLQRFCPTSAVLGFWNQLFNFVFEDNSKVLPSSFTFPISGCCKTVFAL